MGEYVKVNKKIEEYQNFISACAGDVKNKDG